MPSVDLSPLIAAINTGFTSLVAAVSANQPVDLAPLTDQVERVADAMVASNTQIATVIGVDANGDERVRTETRPAV